MIVREALNPNWEQQQNLAKQFEYCRYIYNRMLAQSRHNHEKARLRLIRLVEENDFIGLEDLNIQGMLAYKDEWVGCQVEKVK
jgi:hypothetical protein